MPLEVSHDLAEDDRLALYKALAQLRVLLMAHVGASPEVLDIEISAMSREDQLAAAANLDQDPAFLHRLSQKTRYLDVLEVVSRNTSISYRTAIFLADSQNTSVILNLIGNPASDCSEANDLLICRFEEIYPERGRSLELRDAFCRRRNLSVEACHKLIDYNWRVLLQNPYLPEEFITLVRAQYPADSSYVRLLSRTQTPQLTSPYR